MSSAFGQVKILTGDAPAIAVKVARDIGLLPVDTKLPSTTTTGGTNSDVVTGAELEALAKESREAFVQAVRRCVIFAKLSPYQKSEVVEALRGDGLTVSLHGFQPFFLDGLFQI